MTVSAELLSMAFAAWSFFLYGIYTILFGLCTYILLKRRRTSSKYNLFANILLYLLATINLILTTGYDVYTMCQSCFPETTAALVTSVELPVVCSAVAEAILLWRCYTIWGGQWKVVIIPLLLDIVIHIVAIVLYSGFFVPSYVGTIVTATIAIINLLLSTLIAFQIISIGRQVTYHTGLKAHSMYRMITATTLESGMLYAAFLITIAALQGDEYHKSVSGSKDRFQTTAAYPSEYAAQLLLMRGWPYIAGITTSVIIVRVTLGVALNDVQTELTTLRATEGPSVWPHGRRSARTDSVTSSTMVSRGNLFV